MAPLFAIGTSIGANILVKYLGEEGEKTPLRGAVAICSPWDLLIGDRFICRTFKQKLYDKASDSKVMPNCMSTPLVKNRLDFEFLKLFLKLKHLLIEHISVPFRASKAESFVCNSLASDP